MTARGRKELFTNPIQVWLASFETPARRFNEEEQGLMRRAGARPLDGRVILGSSPRTSASAMVSC